MPTRRILVLGLALAAASDASAQAGESSYRGFSVDLTAVPQRRRAALEPTIRRQIDIVADLKIKPQAAQFFRQIPVIIDPATRSAGHAGRNGLTLNDEVMPPDNPVLLHELLHMYHARQLSGGLRNAQLIRFFEQAKTAGWPKDAYMLENVKEFFAMTASVALFGQASRPPSTRMELRRRMPALYAWIAAEFGLSG
jgi:hypothetical protein